MPTLAFALEIAADIDGNSHQPRLNRTPEIQPVEIFEGSEEDFLRGVLGFIHPAKKTAGERHYPSLVLQNNLLECPAVSCQCLSNKGFDFERLRRRFVFRQPRHQK